MEKGFKETGKTFNVHGTTIVKWCIKYGMPKYIKDYKTDL